MSYDPTLLSTVPIYRIRFTLQDTDPDNEFLVDDELTYLLSKHGDNETLSTVDAAKRMLAQFAQYTREREGLIEVYGNEIFNQWQEYLKDLIKDLTSSSTVSYMILGGVVKTEVDRVKCDGESVDGGYEQGYIDNQRTWLSSNLLGRRNLNNPFRLD
jgi:hypothetical protein